MTVGISVCDRVASEVPPPDPKMLMIDVDVEVLMDFETADAWVEEENATVSDVSGSTVVDVVSYSPPVVEGTSVVVVSEGVECSPS